MNHLAANGFATTNSFATNSVAINGLLILVVCFLTCAGQLFQKKAVQNWEGKMLGWKTKLCDKWLWAAIISLGFGMLVWLIVLRFVPLNIAYPMLSVNFILVTLASQFWFGEQTGLQHWCGISFIMLGVIILGMNL
jgi:undecaprenyl phosphate-alpha-L-ara4N flippase subunit ArnE